VQVSGSGVEGQTDIVENRREDASEVGRDEDLGWLSESS
jgi:hypothetical protein